MTKARKSIREGLEALDQGRTGLENLEGQVDDLVAAHTQTIVNTETERTRAATAATVATAEITYLREQVSAQTTRVTELEAEGREAAASLLALRSVPRDGPEVQARFTSERDAARTEATRLTAARDTALADVSRVTADRDVARAEATFLTVERYAARAEVTRWLHCISRN